MLSRCPPAASVSDHVSACMDSSGVIHGPPDDDQPGQLCMANSNPRRPASRAACCSSAMCWGLPYSTGPLGMPVPTWKIWKPPQPTRFMASRSRVIPISEIFPFIQCHHVRASAVEGGLRKASSSVAAGVDCAGRRASTPKVSAPAAQVCKNFRRFTLSD